MSSTPLTLDVLGPTVQVLTPVDGDPEAPCALRGTIPPGLVVPLHAHPDPETFVMLSGELDGFQAPSGWRRARPGDAVHVPGGVRHAWRNPGAEAAVSIVVTTARMGAFFAEIGTPLAPGERPAGPPAPDAVERLLRAAARLGHWNASPAENAAIGIALPGA